MAAGIAVGIWAPEFARQLAPLASIFLRLIRSIIAPLLVGVLVVSMAGTGGLREMGRIGLKCVVYFEAVTTVALLLGWAAIAWLQPGTGMALGSEKAAPLVPPNFQSIVENLVPSSLMDALSRGDVLQIVIFCLLFGAAAAAVRQRATKVIAFCDALRSVAFQYTSYVMYAAPVGVFAAMAATIGENGLGVLSSLGKFVAVAWAAQLVYALFLAGLLRLTRAPFPGFWHAIQEPMLVAFGTTSSAAALPPALRNLERYGVPRAVLGIAMPLGLSFNLGGSTVHLAMAAFFVAQAAQIPLSVTQQLMILLTLKLTSKGVAGVPRANFVVLTALFASFGLPLEGLAMLLGVDALVDPVRTSINVLSNSVAPVVIAKWEGQNIRHQT